MNRHVFVISHRRSGTHLTIDSIRNNFERLQSNNYTVAHRLEDEGVESWSLDKFKEQLRKGQTVIKMHFLPKFELYTSGAKLEFLQHLFLDSKKIYVYRNGKDVMVSLYKYMQIYDEKIREMSFGDFLRMNNSYEKTEQEYSRPKFWEHHINSWKKYSQDEGLDILFIRFEDFHSDYNGTMERISKYLALDLPKKIVDVRSSKKTGLSKKIQTLKKLLGFGDNITRTSVGLRKGKVGDHQNFFDVEDEEYFLEAVGDTMNKLGYKV